MAAGAAIVAIIIQRFDALRNNVSRRFEMRIDLSKKSMNNEAALINRNTNMIKCKQSTNYILSIRLNTFMERILMCIFSF